MDVRAWMEFLLARRARGLPVHALSDLLNQLFWCLDEQAVREVVRVRLEWLEGDDPERVEAALAMDQVLPYDDGELLAKKVAAIGARWPELRDRAQRLVELWDQQQRW